MHETTTAPSTSTTAKRTTTTRTAARRALGGLSALSLTTAAAVGMVSGGSAMAGGGPGDPHPCDGAICLSYDVAYLVASDTDGDGFSDADERAAGTDPEDPASHPALLKVVDLVAAGRLPSFEKGLSALMILPDRLPDGVKSANRDSLAELTSALGDLMPSRKDALARLGISSKLLDQLGVAGSDVFGLVAGMQSSKGEPEFEAMIGGMRASWIADGAGGSSGTGVRYYEDGSTSHKVVTWFETTDAGAVSYEVDFELCGTNCTGDVSVTVKGGGQDDSCSTFAGIGCFGDLGDVADTAWDKGKDAEKDHSSAAPKDPNATQPAGGASQQPSSGATQPAGGSSQQPSSGASAQPSATTSAKDPDEGEDEEEYSDPDAVDYGSVVVMPGDVKRVVGLIRGKNSTPAQIDRGLPELDAKDLTKGHPEIELWDSNWDGGGYATTPRKSSDQNTNYGPNGPNGPKP